jgi:hypothetical protein
MTERNSHARSIKAQAGNSTLKIGCANRFCGYVASMYWQQVISLSIVALAAGLLLWGRFHRRKFSFERDTHCGCSAHRSAAEKSSILYRARKGERREVVVRMK